DFISAPITADINYDGFVDIIATSSKGNVYCFDGKTKNSIRFTTSFGGNTIISPVLVNYDTDMTVANSKNISALIGIDCNNLLSVYSISTDSLKNAWDAKHVNFTNNNLFVSSVKSEPSSDFFPTTKAYNWPNPVYGSSTKIRYYVAENSVATVKIFDLSGALVTSLSGNATGGMDNEIEWEIGKVQSGVYYANLEVVSASGKSANKIIKIAVIK
ncbi:MAG: T9SS type A sorting domain-containing protein, partial [Ignavibacteria bacterium]|nr:T9SS type A sorting domain-containing protein [Ignavibacteria bacterium]